MVGLAVLLVVDQVRFVGGFSRHWVNEDQTLLWYAARDLGRLRIPQPSFYGQSYATVFEALPAELLRWFGVPLDTGVPLATAVLVVGGWLLLSVVAWWRGHPVLAAAAFALPVVARDEFLISLESPGGRAAAIALAMGATAVLLLAAPDSLSARTWADSPPSGQKRAGRGWVGPARTRRGELAVLAVAFGAAAMAAAWNPTTIVLVAPVVACAVLTRWSWRVVAIAAASALPAVGWMVWAGRVIEQRPDYDLHGSIPFAPRTSTLRMALGELGRYVELAAPELAPSTVVPLGAYAVLLVALAATRRPAAIVAGVLAGAGFVFLLASPKALDGTLSPWLSFGRYAHLVPAALWFLAVVVAESWPGRPRLPAVTQPALFALIVAFALASFAARSVDQQHRFTVLSWVGERTTGAPVGPRDGVLERCDDALARARASDADLIVFRFDRTSTYACGAFAYGDVVTLFPPYERRTWLLREESERRRDRFVVTEADGAFCAKAAEIGLGCDVDDDGLALVSGDGLDVLGTVEALGEELRPFVRAGKGAPR